MRESAGGMESTGSEAGCGVAAVWCGRRWNRRQETTHNRERPIHFTSAFVRSVRRGDRYHIFLLVKSHHLVNIFKSILNLFFHKHLIGKKKTCNPGWKEEYGF